MIAALLLLWLMWWGCWLMLRNVQPPQAKTPLAAPRSRAAGSGTALGLEDDPDQWHATRGAWTAWDEHQLFRLLTASAPVNRPTKNSNDSTGPRIENGDTA